MKLNMRWFGPQDPITLREIAQVPCISGIVSSLHDIPAGEAWTLPQLLALKQEVESAGFSLDVIESIPVHEQIKLGGEQRDKFIDNYCHSVQVVGEAGIPVVCYNFMPIFDWTRTDLARPMPDGSTVLSYDHDALATTDPLDASADLPGWAVPGTIQERRELFAAYESVEESALWENLGYFLERVIPVAEQSNVLMGIHPDDPPWSIFGLPRIITNYEALERVLNLVDNPANGLSLCTGSLGANPENDLPKMVRDFGGRGRIHFAHCRNINVEAAGKFHESPHTNGSVDMRAVMQAYADVNFTGPLRPDHGRCIWNDKGHPGYGLYDRSLGAMYLAGLWEAAQTR